MTGVRGNAAALCEFLRSEALALAALPDVLEDVLIGVQSQFL